jgi:dihydroneopterin aldolase
MPTDVIRISNASFYAYHGVASDEQNLGGKFEIDLELRCNLSSAKESDDLRQTVNYEAVYALLTRIVTSKKYFLLEALAHTITRGTLQAFPIIQEVTVRVRKPHPPVKGVVDFVEVEVTQQQE